MRELSATCAPLPNLTMAPQCFCCLSGSVAAASCQLHGTRATLHATTRCTKHMHHVVCYMTAAHISVVRLVTVCVVVVVPCDFMQGVRAHSRHEAHSPPAWPGACLQHYSGRLFRADGCTSSCTGSHDTGCQVLAFVWQLCLNQKVGRCTHPARARHSCRHGEQWM